MKLIGLTGGIGSGKSTVARMLRDEGIPVIDADLIAREAVLPGTPAHAEIVKAFGPGILLPDGRIDRRKLGDVVFSSPERRADLESITHPRIVEAIAAETARLAARGHPVAVVEAALIHERGRKGTFDAVIAVWCDEETRVRRLAGRGDDLTAAQVKARMAAQMDAAEKARLSEHVVDNSGDPEETRRQVRELAERLKRRQSL